MPKKRKGVFASPEIVMKNKLKSFELDLSRKSEVRPSCLKSSHIINSFVSITHERSFGANNWLAFIGENKSNNSSNNELKSANRDDSCQDKTGVIMDKQSNRLKTENKLFPKPFINKKESKASTRPKSDCGKLGLTPTQQKTMIVSKIGTEQSKQTSYQGGTVHKNKKFSDKKFTESNGQKNENKHLITKVISLDCEMVGVEIGVNKSMLARVSIVNFLGDCIYDKYVKPTEPVIDFRTRVSGIRPKDLKNASDFKTVQKEVADILSNRILVGHALKNDLGVLLLSHPKFELRDTSKFHKFRVGKTPSLKNLAKQYLGQTIQEGEHSSVQDAQAAMNLYRMFKNEWETSIKCRKVKFSFQKEKKKLLPVANEHIFDET